MSWALVNRGLELFDCDLPGEGAACTSWGGASPLQVWRRTLVCWGGPGVTSVGCINYFAAWEITLFDASRFSRADLLLGWGGSPFQLETSLFFVDYRWD